MKRKELKNLIRQSDIVKIWSKTLNIFVQVNKSKLLESLDNEIAKDSTWTNVYFSSTTKDSKITLLIN